MASYSPTVTPMVNKESFEDMMAEKANLTPNHQPRHVIFMGMVQGGLTSIPHNFGKKWHYHQGQLFKTIQKKFGSMQQHKNFKR